MRAARGAEPPGRAGAPCAHKGEAAPKDALLRLPLAICKRSVEEASRPECPCVQPWEGTSTEASASRFRDPWCLDGGGAGGWGCGKDTPFSSGVPSALPLGIYDTHSE